MFNDKAVRNKKALPGSGDRTITIRQFILMLKEYAIFDITGSIPSILEAFMKNYPFLVYNGAYNLEHEVSSI